MILILSGYMGSGKSLIGRKLADKLNYSFIDLDQEIVKRENLEISEIFAHKGEIYFRRKEIETLKHFLKMAKNTVLALGGGTPCYGSNLELIQNNPQTKHIYLKVNLDTLTERLFAEREKRPLIKGIATKDDLNDYIRKHLFERQYYYLQSDFNVDSSISDPDIIVEKIIERLETVVPKK